jgi:hypothetical protein
MVIDKLATLQLAATLAGESPVSGVVSAPEDSLLPVVPVRVEPETPVIEVPPDTRESAPPFVPRAQEGPTGATPSVMLPTPRAFPVLVPAPSPEADAPVSAAPLRVPANDPVIQLRKTAPAARSAPFTARVMDADQAPAPNAGDTPAVAGEKSGSLPLIIYAVAAVGIGALLYWFLRRKRSA